MASPTPSTFGTVATERYQAGLGYKDPAVYPYGYGGSVTVAGADAHWMPWVQRCMDVGDSYSLGSFLQQWRAQVERMPDYQPGNGWSGHSSLAAYTLLQVASRYGRNTADQTALDTATPKTIVSVEAVESGAITLTPAQQELYDAAKAAGGGLAPAGSVALNVPLEQYLAPAPTFPGPATGLLLEDSISRPIGAGSFGLESSGVSLALVDGDTPAPGGFAPGAQSVATAGDVGPASQGTGKVIGILVALVLLGAWAHSQRAQ